MHIVIDLCINETCSNIFFLLLGKLKIKNLIILKRRVLLWHWEAESIIRV